MAGISTLMVSIFYLIPQMVGAGVLIEPLLGMYAHAAAWGDLNAARSNPDAGVHAGGLNTAHHPHHRDRLATAIEMDGELHLVAHGDLGAFGQRLQGRFALVRTGVERGKEDWLLIRKREDAVEGWDIDDYPTSMLTGRTNDEVAAGVPGVVVPGRTLADIDLSAARPAGRTAFVKPMLATAVD